MTEILKEDIQIFKKELQNCKEDQLKKSIKNKINKKYETLGDAYRRKVFIIIK